MPYVDAFQSIGRTSDLGGGRTSGLGGLEGL